MAWPGRGRNALKASSCGCVTAFLGMEKGRAVYAEPGNGQGGSINLAHTIKSVLNSYFLLLSFFYSFNLMLLHQSHELVQHWKRNSQLSRRCNAVFENTFPLCTSTTA